ncbi:hypothetical protein PISMIDRAFT_105783 [Pisolithus microcarpus 441]|uniref:Endonuclease/exonuclease/phosphatase domain-containing protein n=1 Tax=Pisolithus microcarpus 441 TaxID=765257 RepID=A0A0C9Z2K9_9AGAM|nr:hypothetical protein PISMIDRAFT_105783 [Pisolithus microcarpus 441]
MFNIKGKYHPNKEYKYKDLSTIIRKHNILCTALQETKLTPDEEINLQNIATKILILNNPNTMNDRSAGTAFVLNKDKLKNKTWDHTILIPGRAARIKIKTENKTQLDILNIYSPNETNEKINFWKTLNQKIKDIPDWENPILMGDFNFVESAIDRLPAHRDERSITNAFNPIKEYLKIVDGWRIHNETEQTYTFQKTNPPALTHIDRIYVNKNQTDEFQNWEITENYNLSNHQIVITEKIPKTTPIKGPGLWRLNNSDEQHLPTRKRIKKTSRNHQKTTGIPQHKQRKQKSTNHLGNNKRKNLKNLQRRIKTEKKPNDQRKE